MTIKYDITSEIDAQIDAMSVGTGYNFDYDNINQYKPGSKTYPNVKTFYSPDDYDDPEDQFVDSYFSNLTAIFVVTLGPSSDVRLDHNSRTQIAASGSLPANYFQVGAGV